VEESRIPKTTPLYIIILITAMCSKSDQLKQHSKKERKCPYAMRICEWACAVYSRQENDTSLVLDGTKKAKKGAPESAHITKGEIGHKPKITNKEKLGLIQNPNGTGTALRA
jgi:hypothetical protein